MKKENLIIPALSLLTTIAVSADENRLDLFLLPAVSGTSGVTSVSTSHHEAGSAAASYTLGSGNGSSSVQTTTGSPSSGDGGGTSAAYEETKYDSPSTGGSSSSRRSSTRRSSGGGSTASTGSAPSGYDAGASAKGGIPVLPAAASPMTFHIEAGYESNYVYHGLSQIENAIDSDFGHDTSEMYFAGVGMQWKGLALGVKYVRSQRSNLNPRFNPSTTKQMSYEEYVFDINYTLGLIAGPAGAGNWLDATIGYQLLSFQEDTFWNTDSQHELYAKLKMNRYQWVRPSVTYSDFSQGDALTTGTTAPGAEILEGKQLLVQVDGAGLIYDGGSYQVSAGYYAQVGFDKGYNSGSTSFQQNWYQYGVSLPVSFQNVTVTPSVHYTDARFGGITDSFWWGLSAKYTF